MRASTWRKLLARIVPVPDVGCWLWDGPVNAKGYAVGGRGLVHRAMYEQYRGAIPAGLNVLHKCDVRCCVNPNHLYVGTQKQNVADMWKRGRANHKGQRPGEGHSLAKLTAYEVAEIRDRYRAGGVTQQVLASLFSVSREQIGKIVRMERWAA